MHHYNFSLAQLNQINRNVFLSSATATDHFLLYCRSIDLPLTLDPKQSMQMYTALAPLSLLF